jgi:hypothetical protein
MQEAPPTNGRAKGHARTRGGITLTAILALLALLPTTTHATELPDNRGYELVSPINNLGGNVLAPITSAAVTEGVGGAGQTERLISAAADGHAILYVSDPPEETGGGGGEREYSQGDEVLAERGPTGWSVGAIEPKPGIRGEPDTFVSFSKNLSIGILDYKAPTPLTPDSPQGYNDLYTRRSSDGSLAPLLRVTPPDRGPSEFGTQEGFSHYPLVFAGGSANFEHLLFEANDALTPNAVDGGEEKNNLYDSVDGQLRLVNVLPNGTTEANAVFGGEGKGNEGEIFEPGHDHAAFNHAISEDGSQIFWTDLNTGDLYMREDGARTVQVDAAVGGGGRFLTASADGSKVIFTKGGDLYEFRVAGEQTVDLTPGGEVRGLMGASEDGSYVYFVAGGALAAGATQQECGASREATSLCNLYLWHEGEPVRFIAKISSGDNEFAGTGEYAYFYGDWRESLHYRTAQVTPGGQHLVFMSHAELTNYKFNPPVAEVYVYDAADGGHISCASCNPSGEPPAHKFVSAFLTPSFHDTVAHRWISEDGTRVFFSSLDALVPQDTNGVTDVYEWEQDGAGECHTSGGCIYLLSGGESVEHSFLADVSANGNDVFIITRAQLVPQDQNENVDLYDVRADAPRPPVAPECTVALCEEQSSAESAPPVFGAPSSSTFSGAGNVAVAAPAKPTVKLGHRMVRCNKGRVKRKGKCVKKKIKSKKAQRSARGRK